MLQSGWFFQCDFKSILDNIYSFDTNTNDIVEHFRIKWGAMGHLRNNFHLLDIHKVTIWCVSSSQHGTIIHQLTKSKDPKKSPEISDFQSISCIKKCIFLDYKSSGITLMLSKTSQNVSIVLSDVRKFF